jgi:GTP 3',8-cyclase
LLSRYARPLAEAGLQRVNLSLDTLDPEKYKLLTRGGNLQDFWKGVKAAEEAGLTPIKLNAVIARDHNEEDVIKLARLTVDRPWQVRYIEMMPFAGATEFQQNLEVKSEEMLSWLEAEFGPLERINFGKLDGEARVFRIQGALGTIGFIATVSHPFCETCSRARLTADGKLRMCLLRENEVDLLGPMRKGASDAELRDMIQEGIWEKPWGHRLEHDEVPLNRMMSQIGG